MLPGRLFLAELCRISRMPLAGVSRGPSIRWIGCRFRVCREEDLPGTVPLFEAAIVPVGVGLRQTRAGSSVG